MANTNVPDEGDTLTPAQRAWVDALRSGEYKQTTNVLCRLGADGKPVGHCCLGVACDLAVKAGLVEQVTRDTITRDGEVWSIRAFDDSRTFLPVVVVDWLGLDDVGGEFEEEGFAKSLASLNDAGLSFDGIADIIESRPAGLFEVSS